MSSVLLFTACQFDPVIEGTSPVTCGSNDECPRGYVCVLQVGRCLPQSGDKDPPTVSDPSLSPVRVGRAGTLSISFTSSEVLFGEPKLTLSGASLASREPAERGEAFTFTYPVTADDAAGSVTVGVNMVDLSGNEAIARVGDAVFDFTPPTVLAPSVKVQPAVAHPGDSVLVQLAFSELLQTPPQVLLAGMPYAPLSAEGTLATFQFPIAATAADGTLGIELQALTDLAGNITPAQQVATLRVDTHPPHITKLEIANGVTVRSAQPGFDTFTVLAEADPGTGDTLASLEIRMRGQPLTCTSPTPTSRSCAVTVTSATPEGDAQLQAFATDAVGNTEVANTTVRIDRTPPAIAVGTDRVTYTPAPGALVQQISALAAGAQSVFTFTLTEEAIDPVSVTLGSVALTCTHSGVSWSCPYTHACNTLPDGQYRFSIHATDVLGNALALAQVGSLSVVTDCTAPLPPRVDQAGKVVWHRAPFGAAGWSAGKVGSRLELTADAVAEATATIRIGVDQGQGRILTVNLAPAGTTVGATLIPTLDELDRPQVYVQTIDTAGNASAAVRVQDNVSTLAFLGAAAAPNAPGMSQLDLQTDTIGAEGDAPWSTATMKRAAVKVQGMISPGLQAGHRMASLPNGRVLLFGSNGTWVFDELSRRWGQRAAGSQPVSRKEHQMVTINGGRVLLFGGLTAAAPNTPLGDTWLFDSATGLWSQLFGTQPPPRNQHAMAVLGNGNVLLFGGINTSPLSDTWIFDTNTLTWSQLSATGPVIRSQHSLARLGTGDALLVGGLTDPVFPYVTATDTWVFETSTRRWVRVTGNQPPGRYLQELVTIGNGQAMLLGGMEASSWNGGFPRYFADCWLFDPSTRLWTELTSVLLPAVIGHQVAALSNNRVLLTGGFRQNGLNPDTWLFDAHDNSWNIVASNLSAARGYAPMASLSSGGALLMGGGNTGGLADTRIFDGTTATWSALPHLQPPPRRLHVMASLQGGKALIASGIAANTFNGYLRDAWTFDSSTFIWSAQDGGVPNIPTDGQDRLRWVSGPGSTVLTLVATGGDTLYDSTNQTWTPATGGPNSSGDGEWVLTSSGQAFGFETESSTFDFTSKAFTKWTGTGPIGRHGHRMPPSPTVGSSCSAVTAQVWWRPETTRGSSTRTPTPGRR